MRLFIAIDLPVEIMEYVSPLQASLDKDSAKLTLAKSSHLTLKFLGEVDEDKVNNIIKCLEGVKFRSFQLYTTNIGVFKNWNYLSVIWLGLKESSDPNVLHSDIEKSLSEFNFKTDFEFHPHITLSRVSYVNKRDALKESTEKIKTEEKEFVVSSFVLYQSTLTQVGAVYNKIKEFRVS
jgi:RNA 2',3'-cyclic 3'-phosphodiesterase